jgi:hypothetical protein
MIFVLVRNGHRFGGSDGRQDKEHTRISCLCRTRIAYHDQVPVAGMQNWEKA